jgi:hypothetical protein
VQLPVAGTGVAVEQATLNGEDIALISEENWHKILLEGAGDYRVLLSFYVQVEVMDGIGSFHFATPAASVMQMRLQLPEAEAQVLSPVPAQVVAHTDQNTLEATLVFSRTEEVAVSWRKSAPLPEEQPEAAPPEPPRVSAQVSTLATVSESHVSCESLVQFAVLRGEVNAFRIVLPQDAQVLQVLGKGLEWESAIVEEKDQVVTVKLNHMVTDTYALTATYETPIPEAIPALRVPALGVEDVVRHSGYLAVGTEGNIEIDLNPASEKLRRIDVNEVPSELRGRSVQPILHAFQYSETPYLLALDYHRLEDVPVRIAAIERARLTTVVTEEGLHITHAEWLMRNHHLKFMRVAVPAEAEIWGARVAGEAVKPARNDEGSDSGQTRILIPLRRSGGLGEGSDLFSVELAYLERGKAPKPWLDSMAMTAPQPDVGVNRLEWEVLLPEAWEVYRSTGDVNAVDTLIPAMMGRMPSYGVGEDYRMENLYRHREGLERFFITDINNPAASAQVAEARPEDRYDPGKQQDPGQVHKRAASVAGVVPVDLNVPRFGTAHYFARTVVPEDTPLQLRVDLLGSYTTALYRGLWRAILFLVAFWGAWQGWRLFRGNAGSLRGLLLAVLLILGALLAGEWLLGMPFRGNLPYLLMGALLGVLLGAFRSARTPEARA